MVSAVVVILVGVIVESAVVVIVVDTVEVVDDPTSHLVSSVKHDPVIGFSSRQSMKRLQVLLRIIPPGLVPGYV